MDFHPLKITSQISSYKIHIIMIFESRNLWKHKKVQLHDFLGEICCFYDTIGLLNHPGFNKVKRGHQFCLKKNWHLTALLLQDMGGKQITLLFICWNSPLIFHESLSYSRFQVDPFFLKKAEWLSGLRRRREMLRKSGEEVLGGRLEGGYSVRDGEEVRSVGF